eukprot:PhF_6_TR38096/c0_g1_i1/m.56833
MRLTRFLFKGTKTPPVTPPPAQQQYPNPVPPRQAPPPPTNPVHGHHHRPAGPQINTGIGAPSTHKQSTAESRWWPLDDKWSGRQRRDLYDPEKRYTWEGTLVPEVKKVPTNNPDEFTETLGDDWFFHKSNPMLYAEQLPHEQNFLPPPPFNPELDDLEEREANSPEIMKDIVKAADEDKRRMIELGNPITAQDALDAFLMPSRETPELQQQRDEFNGFIHWGMLHAANVALRNNDMKMAHQLVNRYVRDLDLFAKWMEHEKVRRHMLQKFKFDTKGKLDKLMANVMAMYMRSKVQVFESDFSGALRSLIAGIGMLRDSGDVTNNPRHRKAMGILLGSRGFVFLKLDSPDRALEDLNNCMPLVPANRAVTLYQLRAEALERLGRIEEARKDEERAAEIVENAEVVYAGLDQPPQKWIM